MMIHRVVFFFFALVAHLNMNAQSTNLINNDRARYFVDRLDVLSKNQMDIHTSIHRYKNGKIALESLRLYQDVDQNDPLKNDIKYLLNHSYEYLKTGQKNNQQQSNFEKEYIDSTNQFYTINDNEESYTATPFDYDEKGWLSHFYKSPANFYELKKKDFYLKINPIINFRYGRTTDHDRPIFQNTRGIELSGLIDDKVYFYTNIIENQVNFLPHIEERIERFLAIPGNGNYKDYESSVLSSFIGYDVPEAVGYVGLPISKHINIELGHGKHFIGNGIRSLLLSENSNNYFYLRFDTHIWKFHYRNIFAELSPISGRQQVSDGLLPKKYMTSHFLSFKPWKNMELGLFETVVFGRENHFELQYLNPIIFYRAVEFALDSPDNVILGLNGKWNIIPGVSLYGQFVLDEFKLDQIRAQNGWWGNKYGLQLGLKYYEAFNIPTLDLQVEYNGVRPYTFSHNGSLEDYPNQSLSNYSHYNLPLAHPLGANFKEWITLVRYRPVHKLLLELRLLNTTYGEDENDQNFGGNILLPNDTRIMDLGNYVGQGVTTTVRQAGLNMTYELRHNYYIDIDYLYHNRKYEDGSKNSLHYFGGGLRVNINRMSIDY